MTMTRTAALNTSVLKILSLLMEAGLDSSIWLPPILAAVSGGASPAAIAAAVSAGVQELDKLLAEWEDGRAKKVQNQCGMPKAFTHFGDAVAPNPWTAVANAYAQWQTDSASLAAIQAQVAPAQQTVSTDVATFQSAYAAALAVGGPPLPA